MIPYSKEQHCTTLKLIENIESNAKTYARTFNRVMARGYLSKIWDVEEREYIDCLACAGALPLGHNHPVVMEAIDLLQIRSHSARIGYPNGSQACVYGAVDVGLA